MAKKSEKEKRVKKLLMDGMHVIDSGRKVAIWPTTMEETPHNSYDPVSPCKPCGRTDLTVQLV